MKRTYIKPELEPFSYLPEKGYATTVALNGDVRDFVVVEGTDRRSMLHSDEVSEYTDNSGEYTTGRWDWE